MVRNRGTIYTPLAFLQTFAWIISTNKERFQRYTKIQKPETLRSSYPTNRKTLSGMFPLIILAFRYDFHLIVEEANLNFLFGRT